MEGEDRALPSECGGTLYRGWYRSWFAKLGVDYEILRDEIQMLGDSIVLAAAIARNMV